MKNLQRYKYYITAGLSLAITFLLAASSPSYGEGTGHGFNGERIVVAANETGATAPILDPTDPNSVIYLDAEGKKAGLGDPSKPASETWRMGQGWHPAALDDARLPKDKFGLIDWVELVNKGMIRPKHSLDPDIDEFPPLDMDVIIEAKGDFVDDVRYPHSTHTYWLSCQICHPKIFVPAKGQNNMTMVGIVEGKWCGRCHGKVSFPLTDCNRCHNVPKNVANQ